MNASCAAAPDQHDRTVMPKPNRALDSNLRMPRDARQAFEDQALGAQPLTGIRRGPNGLAAWSALGLASPQARSKAPLDHRARVDDTITVDRSADVEGLVPPTLVGAATFELEHYAANARTPATTGISPWRVNQRRAAALGGALMDVALAPAWSLMRRRVLAIGATGTAALCLAIVVETGLDLTQAAQRPAPESRAAGVATANAGIVFHVTVGGGVVGERYRRLFTLLDRAVAHAQATGDVVVVLVAEAGFDLLTRAKWDPDTRARIREFDARGVRFLVSRRGLERLGADARDSLGAMIHVEIVEAASDVLGGLARLGFAYRRI